MDVMWFVYALIFLVALVQTPVLVDVLRFLFPKWRVTRLTNQAASLLLMLTMTSIAFIALGYYFTFLHLVVEDPWHSARGVCHIVFAGWVFVNMAANYAMAVFVDPGIAVRGDALQDSDAKNSKTDDDSRVESKDKASDRISTDDANSSDIHLPTRKNKSEAIPLPQSGMEWKLKNSSFCKVCRNEVLYLDHHCPFTGSCVGIRNYSYFFLCMVYGSIGLGYGLLLTLPFFIQCKLSRPLWYLGLGVDQSETEVCRYLQHHLFLAGPLTGGWVVTTTLLLIQVFLLLSDLTTYGVLKNFSKLPVMRFAWERIRRGKFRDADSRLNLVLLRQRPGPLWFLIPVRNSID